MLTELYDATSIRTGELPVFRACGVTPQWVVAHAKPSFCITHYPGHMLITDLTDNEFSVLWRNSRIGTPARQQRKCPRTEGA
jgi:hypothetical protein